MLELGHLKDLAAAHHVLPEPLEKVLRLQECWEPDTTRPTRLIGPPILGRQLPQNTAWKAVPQPQVTCPARIPSKAQRMGESL